MSRIGFFLTLFLISFFSSKVEDSKLIIDLRVTQASWGVITEDSMDTQSHAILCSVPNRVSSGIC